MGVTIGIKASINHPHLDETIKMIINNFVDNNHLLKYELKQEKITSEDINDYIEKINNPVVDNLVMVGIIYQFDIISLKNQNKLLKTIEDNKDQVQIIIFEHEDKVLDTIKSRLVIYHLEDKIKTDDKFLQIFSPNLYYWLVNNDDISLIYKNIYKYCQQLRFEEAYIIYRTKIQKPQLVDVEIIQTIILNALFNNKRFELYKNIQQYEAKNAMSLDLSLLIDSMFCDLLLNMR